MDDGSGSGDMDVLSEPLGDFYWSMRSNNFVGAAGVIQEGIAVDPLLAVCELEAHDLYQAELDYVKSRCNPIGNKKYPVRLN